MPVGLCFIQALQRAVVGLFRRQERSTGIHIRAISSRMTQIVRMARFKT
jgi:hypothetical protein